MKRWRPWFSGVGGGLLLVACIDSNDTLVGEMHPDSSGGTSGTGESGGTSGTGESGGTSGDGSSGSSGSGASGVGGACEAGDVRHGEHCQTCTCEDGSWSCFQPPCPPCFVGDESATIDGCNTCTCVNGVNRECTNRECGACPAPVPPTPCLTNENYFRMTETQTCCYYADPCTAPTSLADGAYPTYGACMGGPTSWGSFADCDGDSSNGYETDIKNTIENCGGCGILCATSHATPHCDWGQCVVGACDPGWSDCNASPDDGCESQGTCK